MTVRGLLALLLLAGPVAAAPERVTVTVVATDEAGATVPVAGARVIVGPATDVLWPERAGPGEAAVTDADGKVTVPRPEGPALVAAVMALRGTAVERLPAGRRAVTLTLPPEAVLRGRVLGPDGEPVPGAGVDVALERPEDTGPFLAAGNVAFHEVADAEGVFRVYRLPPSRTLRVRADAPGLARAILRDVDPGAGPVEIRLTKGATVRGLVVATPGGAAVEGARIELGGVTGRTNAEGRFELAGVPPGAWRLRVEAAGHALTREEEIVLAEGDVRVGLLVRVTGTTRLVGRVLSAATAPVEGAEILLRYPPDPERLPELPPDRIVAVAKTGADGRFEAKDLRPAQGVDLIVRHPDHAPTVYLGYSLAAGATVQSVVLMRSGGSVAGRVVDAAGKGVAGAKVYAYPDREDLSGAGAGDLPASPTRRETETGPDGAFRLDHVPAGRRALVAIAPDRVPAVLRGVDVAEGSERTGLLLGTAAGDVLSGRIAAADDEPVAGARVTLRPPLGPARSVATDETGRFAFSGLAPGRYDVQVRAEGYAPLDLAAVETPAPELSLVLAPAGRLVGRLLREDTNDPAAPAVVRAFRRGPPSPLAPDLASHSLEAEVRTADGDFTLPDLPPGSYRVEAVTDAGAYGVTGGLEVGPGAASAPVVVRVYPGQAIRGRVFSATTGMPIEGALVAARDEGRRLSTATGADGSFVLHAVPEGFHTLVVGARDHAATTVESVEVRLGADTTIDDVRLGAGATLRGTVTGEDGDPRIGAEVVLSALEPPETRRVRTDETGTFLVENLTPGPWLLATSDPLAGPGGRRLERLVEIPPEGDVFLALGGGRGSTLTGRITAANEPVAHAGVELLRLGGELDRQRQLLSTRTDADGNYAFPDVAPGEMLLLVRVPGQEAAPARFPVRLPPGPVTIRDFRLPESGVAGGVEDLDTGEPLAGVLLRLTRPVPEEAHGFLARLDREVGETRSGPDGSFRFAAVPAGRYRLEAWRDGYGQTSVEDVRVVPGGDTPVRVAMPPAGTLAGRVIDPEGRGVGNARVSFFLDGAVATRDPFVDVDPDGRFRIDSLRTGTYAVEAVAPGFGRVREEGVRVFPGSVPELSLRLLREGRLIVTVFGPGGRPIEGARVSVRDFWGRPVELPEPTAGLLAPWEPPDRTDERGTITFPNLSPGLYEVRAAHPGLVGPPVRVRVLDGELSRGAVVLLPPPPPKREPPR